MAAKLYAASPEAWPETIRALIVHSATWTQAQKARFLANELGRRYLLDPLEGYVAANVFNFQTKSVLEVAKANAPGAWLRQCGRVARSWDEESHRQGARTCRLRQIPRWCTSR